MSETVYTVVAALRWPWLPGRAARIRQLARFAHGLPGYQAWIELVDRGRTDRIAILLSTAEHARKAQQMIGYKRLEMDDGSAVYVRRLGWMAGAYPCRAELDKEAWKLRVWEPAEGWDSIDPEDRPEGLPWPPPADQPIEELEIEPRQEPGREDE